MQKLFYPAIFHKAEEGGFWVSFPDIPGCLTEGDNMEQAYEMAVDALGLCISDMQENKEALPVHSEPDQITLEADSFLVVIEFDLAEYKRRTGSRAVKKTLSIPEWLNEEATARGVNFSATLQEALREQLGV